MFSGFDWWIWGGLALIGVIIIFVMLLHDLKEIRTQQQLARDKEGFWVTQQDVAYLLAHNNKMILTRIHDVIRETNEINERNGEPPTIAIQLLQHHLAESIRSMEFVGGPLGELTKAQQAMADDVYADAAPELVS